VPQVALLRVAAQQEAREVGFCGPAPSDEATRLPGLDSAQDPTHFGDPVVEAKRTGSAATVSGLPIEYPAFAATERQQGGIATVVYIPIYRLSTDIPARAIVQEWCRCQGSQKG
jgi:hypothetical protein